MVMRWTAAAMLEAEKQFHRAHSYRELPVLRVALAAHQDDHDAPAQMPVAKKLTGVGWTPRPGP